MSNTQRRPVLRVTFKRGETTHSVLSVWPGNYAGTYSVSRDKGTEKYPPISLIDVIKAFAAGDGFVNVSIESQRQQRTPEQRSGGSYDRPARSTDSNGEYPDDFGSDTPFIQRDRRVQC